MFSRPPKATSSRFWERFSSTWNPSSSSRGRTLESRFRRTLPTDRPHRANCFRWNRAMAQQKKPSPMQVVLPLRTAPSQRMASRS